MASRTVHTFVAIAGIAAAGALGGWVAQLLGPQWLRWVIGLSFLAMAGWMLVPDKIDAQRAGGAYRHPRADPCAGQRSEVATAAT